MFMYLMYLLRNKTLELELERRKIPRLPGSLNHYWAPHYSDVIMSAMASQITRVFIAHSTLCSGADQRKHQSSASLVFVKRIHRWPVNFQYKGPVTRNIFPFDDAITERGNIDIGGECSSMKCEVSALPWKCVLMNKINSHPKEFGREPSSPDRPLLILGECPRSWGFITATSPKIPRCSSLSKIEIFDSQQNASLTLRNIFKSPNVSNFKT